MVTFYYGILESKFLFSDGRNLVIVAPSAGLASPVVADSLDTGIQEDTQTDFVFPIDLEIASCEFSSKLISAKFKLI